MPQIRFKLKNIVDGMSMASDQVPGYLDMQTGAVELITEADRDAADSEGSVLKDWERERAAIVRLIDEGSGRFVPLPERFDIDEYQLMEDFIQTMKDPVMSARLDESIQGSGAFRRFKDEALRSGLSEQWFAIRGERYLEAAREGVRKRTSRQSEAARCGSWNTFWGLR